MKTEQVANSPVGRARVVLALLLPALLLLGASCGENVTTQVVPVAQQLPAQREVTRYRMVDSKGADIGSAVLSSVPDGDTLTLGIAYDFGQGRTDNGTVIVRRDSMRPVNAERVVTDGERQYVTRAAYTDRDVTVRLDDPRRPKERRADLSETAYDNLESLFLWRTLDFSTGTQVRYVNVVIDPRGGTISRALGAVEVLGREEVRLSSGPVQAWRVQFRAAGVTNTAWYRADAGHLLVRYEITRGPTLILDQ